MSQPDVSPEQPSAVAVPGGDVAVKVDRRRTACEGTLGSIQGGGGFRIGRTGL